MTLNYQEAKDLFKEHSIAIKDTDTNTIKALIDDNKVLYIVPVNERYTLTPLKDWDYNLTFNPNGGLYKKDSAYLISTKDLDVALQPTNELKNTINKGYTKMSILTLTPEKNPKLAIQVDNALNYKNSAGELSKREPKSALIDVVKEAGNVVGMDKGIVTLAIEVNGNYENFYVNKMKDSKNLVLKPIETADKKESFIYFNAVDKQDGSGHFYMMGDNENSKRLLAGLGTTERENQDGSKSSYIKANARLKNEDIKSELQEKGENFLAIISKSEVKVISKDELKNSQIKEDKTLNQEKPENEKSDKKVVKKKVVKKEKSNDIER